LRRELRGVDNSDDISIPEGPFPFKKCVVREKAGRGRDSEFTKCRE
jgi:hypothetical protein